MTFLLVVLLSLGSQVAYAYDKHFLFDGPNCLNSALIYKGFLKYPRYSSVMEFTSTLKQNDCRKVDGMKSEKGDILIIRNLGKFANSDLISHAFVDIGEGKIFEKIGFSKDASFRVTTKDVVLEEYDVDQKNVVVEAYRCGKSKESNEFFLLEKDLYQAERALLEKNFSQKKMEAFDQAKMLGELLERIERAYGNQITQNEYDVLIYRFQSILYQKSLLEKGSYPALNLELLYQKVESAEVSENLQEIFFK